MTTPTIDGFDEGKWDPEQVGYVNKVIRSNGMVQSPKYWVEQVFNANNWPAYLRRDWLIFGAKWVPCSECHVDLGKPCIYLNDAKSGRMPPRFVKWPHKERVQYRLIYRRFISLGFIIEES